MVVFWIYIVIMSYISIAVIVADYEEQSKKHN
jgi:hypothetical protein